MTKSLNVYRPVRFTGGLYALTLVALVTALSLTACVFRPLKNVDDSLKKWMGEHVYLEVLQGYTYLAGLFVLLCIHAYIHRHRDKYKLLNSREVVHDDDTTSGSDDNDAAADDGGQIETRLEHPRYVTTTTTAQQLQRRIVAHNNQPAISHNSNEVNFYVRIAILIFGTGSMTQGGFKLAHLHQQGTISLSCINLCDVIVTILCILFTFFQAFFLFKNHKIVIRTKRTAFKYGFAHLIATNISTFIITLLKEIQTAAFPIVRRYNGTMLTAAASNGSVPAVHEGFNDGGVDDGWGSGANSTACQQICHLSSKASSYLYPCGIQYCVIAVFVLVKLYHQVGSRWPMVECVRVEWVNPKKEIEFVIDENEEEDEKKDDDTVVVVDDRVAYNPPRSGGERKVTIVDCDKAHKGLFAGLLVVVFTFIMMSCFFVFARSRLRISTSEGLHADLEASYFFYALEYALLIVSGLASLVAMCRFRKLGVVKMKGKKFFNTEKSLLVVAYPSVIILQTFYLVATVYGFIISHLRTPKDQQFRLGVQEILGIMTLCSCVVVLLNAFIQTSFIITAFKRVTSTYQQKREKPGRALVTFLVFCNLALFIVAVFEHERIHYNIMDSPLFNGTFWNVIIRLILPFHILFRLISMASLTAIWKGTYTVSSYL